MQDEEEHHSEEVQDRQHITAVCYGSEERFRLGQSRRKRSRGAMEGNLRYHHRNR